MAFDFNAVKDKNKTKHLSQQARTLSDQLLIYNFIEKYRDEIHIDAICVKRPIEYNDIKIYEGKLEIGENTDDGNNKDSAIFMTNGHIFQEFLDTCVNAGVKKIINPTWLMNDTSEHTIVPLSIHDLDFTDLSLKGLRLELLKNVEATQIQLSNIWFDKQRNINVNTTKGIRISGVFGMKDFSFIKHANIVIFQTLPGYAGEASLTNVPFHHNLKGMPEGVKRLTLNFGNECLKHFQFSTKYIPESVESVYIYFNNMNIDNFDFSYLPLPVEDKDPKEYELVIKASQIQDMNRYITSDGSISNGLISQVKKGEKHFEVPSWSVYTHVMDGPNPKFRKRRVKN